MPNLITRGAIQEMLTAALAAWPNECLGYLIGDGGRAIHAASEVNALTDSHAVYLDPAREDRLKRAVALLWHPSEVVGEWHSHPYRTRCDAALQPKLSRTDRESSPDGLLQVIASVFPRSGAPEAVGDVDVTDLSHVVRAWVRHGGRFRRVQEI